MKKAILTTMLLLTVGCAGGICGALAARRGFLKRIGIMRNNEEKMKEFYDVLTRWIRMRSPGHQIESYLLDKGVKKVAIYGMKELGEILYDELKETSIEVAYAIDRDAEYIFSDLEVVSPEDELKDVDAVIVTAIHYYSEIAENLEKKLKCPILCIEDVIYEIC